MISEETILLRATINKILDLLYARDFTKLNKMLEETDVTSITPVIMIAIIRTSFCAKAFLPAWQPLLDRMRKQCVDTNVPSHHRLFVGLP